MTGAAETGAGASMNSPWSRARGARIGQQPIARCRTWGLSFETTSIPNGGATPANREVAWGARSEVSNEVCSVSVINSTGSNQLSRGLIAMRSQVSVVALRGSTRRDESKRRVCVIGVRADADPARASCRARNCSFREHGWATGWSGFQPDHSRRQARKPDLRCCRRWLARKTNVIHDVVALSRDVLPVTCLVPA
jgi:hypothetical protein